MVALDGQQSASQYERVCSHLKDCWACRARSSALESAIHDFVRTYHRSLDGPVPSAASPRSLLKARLAELAAKSHSRGLGGLAHVRQQRLFYATLAIGLFGVIWLSSVAPIRMPFARPSHMLPDARLTPGLTHPVSWAEICTAGSSDRIDSASISASVAERVFDEYGISNPQPFAYEVDYLITPELGGADDIRNIWPEPYSGEEWNAHVKDAIEERLHEMVCAKEIDLAQAQREIARDWVAAYQKYFEADHPLKEHLAYTKDRPWQ